MVCFNGLVIGDFMKIVLVLILIVLCGCGDSKEDPRDKLIADLQSDINYTLYNMYQTVAKCDDLARCLGGKKGLVQVKDFGPYYKYGHTIDERYACMIIRDSDKKATIPQYNGKKVEHIKINAIEHESVELYNISPALMGCKNRKCGTSCDTK